LDTKSKSSKPFYAWLCFFLAINLIIGTLLASVWGATGAEPFDTLKAVTRNYNQDTGFFKDRIANQFESLVSAVAQPAASQNTTDWVEQVKISLDAEGANLKYYAVNTKTGQTLTNVNDQLGIAGGGSPILPPGYNYYWYYDGQKLTVVQNNKPVDTMRLDSGYHRFLPDKVQYQQRFPDLPNCRVVLAVKAALVENPYSYSSLYEQNRNMRIMGIIVIGLGTLSLVLFILSLVWRRYKRDFDRRLAAWSAQMWLEVKLLLTLPIFFVNIAVAANASYTSDPEVFLLLWIVLLAAGWWIYLMLIDLKYNRQQFFKHNIVNSVLTWYRQYEAKYPWQQAMLKRVYLLIAAEAVLALLAVFFLLAMFASNSPAAFPVALLFTAAGVYLIYRYLRNYQQMVIDLGKLVDHIGRIKNGEPTNRLQLEPDADMYETAENLNSIQEGINTAVEARIKSERMKVELITNVSHDLKTPLTSIISYVDLMAKEENLPEPARDYVAILGQKAERLQQLIQDLFDLSKASSDNIALDLEKIDLTRLIKQTMGDLEEQITASGLTFRLNLPEEPVYIFSDGKKLYRVWENLIANALKYSLSGSRVFVELEIDARGARATIKNTANYEMNFNEDEILQRFFRGDKARSSEGSGLGLSIAQSFTHICGGQLTLKIDGDQFKVELRFPLI